MVPLWMLYAVIVTPGTLRQVQSHVFTVTNKSRSDDRVRLVAKYKIINNQSRILFAPATIKNVGIIQLGKGKRRIIIWIKFMAAICNY